MITYYTDNFCTADYYYDIAYLLLVLIIEHFQLEVEIRNRDECLPQAGESESVPHLCEFTTYDSDLLEDTRVAL